MINKTQKFWNKQAKRYDNNERRFEAVIIKEVIFKTKEYLNKSD